MTKKTTSDALSGMKINVETLEEFEEYKRNWQLPSPWLEEITAPLVEDEEQLFFSKDPADFEVSFHREGEEVHFIANLSGKMEITCVRCLEKGEWKFNSEFFGIFRRREEGEGSDPDDLESFIYEGEEVDFAETAREYLLLEMPSHPVCDENCKGLCPNCGANLNLGACSCSRDEEIDFRWSELLEIKKTLMKK